MGLFNFNNKQKHTAGIHKDDLLEQSLCTIPDTNTDITWGDVVEGTLIMGATGSGKSSGVGKHLAMAMLKSGFGFCVLCVKADERSHWERYAQEAGRTDDLVVFNAASDLKFNFLQYEMERGGTGTDEVMNVNNALMSLNEQSKVYHSGGGNNEERFWDNALRRLISRTITLLRMAGEEISITNMRKLVGSSFQEEEVGFYHKIKSIMYSGEEIEAEKRNQAWADYDHWLQSSYFLRVYEKIRLQEKNENDSDDLELTEAYWLREFATLSERSRSIIIESFFGIIEPFLNQGILKRQFSEGLSEALLPETIIAQRKIVIIDFNIKTFGLAGIYASIIYKKAFQGAMERRNIEMETDPKPVVLWTDEYQNFCNPLHDTLFQTTARSSWVATVCITQNINNLYYVMGNNQPEARAKSLLGNLNLKFFANNSDFETNRWVLEMLGKHQVEQQNLNYSKDMELSKSKSLVWEDKVKTDDFMMLRTGGKRNKYIVEAIVFKPGKLWGKEQENFAVGVFGQRG